VDQLSAHLERGWDLAQRGDTRGAASSARRALELEPDSPEVHNLLGFVAALEGDCEEAVEAYQQAVLLDDGYVEAMLNAAELLVHPMGRYDEALRMCEQVLDISEYDDEVVDALLLKFEALSATGQDDEAIKTLARMPAGPFDNPSQNFLAGRAHFEAGDHATAGRFIEAALAQDERNPEAHYYAGLLSEERGDSRGACVSFLRTRQLELEMGMPAWAPNPETFLLFTQNAIAALDDHLRAFMEGAELYVADLPGPEVVVDGVDPRSSALVEAVFVGPEEPNGSAAELAVEPDQVELRVFLYALNIMRAAAGLHAVQQTIHEALAGELAAALADLELELADANELEAMSQR
jgi:tetratricopeptide (TPR) repeat protein